jgi:hypothetical protein
VCFEHVFVVHSVSVVDVDGHARDLDLTLSDTLNGL